MSRTFFIPGQQPSTGGTGGTGSPKMPTREQLERRHPAFYKNRGEHMLSPMADKGDRVKLHGDEAVVKHVDYNADGTHNLIVQRSSQTDSGTYKVKVEPDKGRKQRIGSIKRTTD